MLRFNAPRSGLRGLYFRRMLGSDRAIPRRDQDVVAFGRGAVLGRVDTVKLDGGAAARRNQGLSGQRARAGTGHQSGPGQGLCRRRGHRQRWHALRRRGDDRQQRAAPLLRSAGEESERRSGAARQLDPPQPPRRPVHAEPQRPPAGDAQSDRGQRPELPAGNGLRPAARATASHAHQPNQRVPAPTTTVAAAASASRSVTPLRIRRSAGSSSATRPAAAQLSAERGSGAYLDTDGNVLRDGLAAGVLFRDGSSGRLRNDVICGMSQVGIQATAAAGRPQRIAVSGVTSALNGGAGVLLSTKAGEPRRHRLRRYVAGHRHEQRLHRQRRQLQPPGRRRPDAQGAEQSMAARRPWRTLRRGGGAGARRAPGQRGRRRPAVPGVSQAPAGTTIDSAFPKAVRRGALVHIYGRGFNAIDGYSAAVASPGAAPTCADLAAGNTCDPDLRGTCVEFVRPGGLPPLAAKVVAVTPTHLVVESPLDCAVPIQVRVRRMTPSGRRTFTSARPIFCLNDDVP